MESRDAENLLFKEFEAYLLPIYDHFDPKVDISGE